MNSRQLFVKPTCAELAQSAVKDHAIEIINQRCIPGGNYFGLQAVVVVDQFMQRHIVELDRSQQLIHLAVKVSDLAIVSKQFNDEPVRDA